VTRDQVFWACYGVVALALAGCALFWGGSVRADVRAERTRWDNAKAQCERLEAGRKNIHNLDSVNKWRDFQKWVASQTEEVASFFARRDKVMERHFVDGTQEPSPADFKAEYNSLRSDSVRDLKRLPMRVWNPEAVFKQYPWSVGNANPEPAEYRLVRKELWITRYLVLGALPSGGVKEVTNLSILPPKPLPGTEFHVIPVSISCLIPADNVTKLLHGLLAVPEGDPLKLFAIVRKVSLKKSPGEGGKEAKDVPPLYMELLLDVIDFEPKSK